MIPATSRRTYSAQAVGSLPDSFAWVVIELAPDGILVADESGRIRLANRQLCRLFAYEHEALIGQRVERLIPARLRAEHIGHRHDYKIAPTVRTMGSGKQLVGCRSDGTEFPVEISLSPVTSCDGMHTVVVIREPTPREAGSSVDGAIQSIYQAGLGLATLSDPAATDHADALSHIREQLDHAVRELQRIAIR